jgi:hypothetical protein
VLLSRPIRTRFSYGFPTRVNISTQRKLAGSFFKRHAVTSPKTRSDGLYAHGFRYYFTPRQGYLSPFPDGTCPISVTKEYLGLTGGPARFARNFRGPVLLGMSSKSRCLTSTGVSPSLPGLSSPSRLLQRFLTLCRNGSSDSMVPRPRAGNACRLLHLRGLASSVFARHYSRNHCCFLFLWVLRCFTSPRSLRTPYVFRRR